MGLIIGLRGSACSGSIRLQGCHHAELALAAYAALHDVDRCDTSPKLDEGFFEHRVRRWQLRLCQCLPTAIESVVFITRAVKSVVTNAHEAAQFGTGIDW